MKFSHNNKNRIIFSLIIILGIILFFVFYEYPRKMTVTYEESNELIQNPFQGTYFQWYTGDPEGLYNVVEAHPDYRVVLLAYNLEDEVEMAKLPEDKIRDLENALRIAEELNLSVIFRAAYDFSGQYEDPEFDVMLGHIEQISPVLNAHKECLMGVQAGMIGAFGEWTQSKYMDTKRYRMEILEAWEEFLDDRIDISVRRQKFIREAVEWGIDTERIGVYNDGLFSSDSDLGTYREDYNREEDLAWSMENIKVPFNGGEMPFVSEFTEVSNVVEEAEKLHLSYLNQEYNFEVWDYWASQEYEGESGEIYIKKHLGWRPWVKQLCINKHYGLQKKVDYEIEMENSGFAMIDPDFHIYIIMSCQDKQIVTEGEIFMNSSQNGIIRGSVEHPFTMEELAKSGLTIGIQISKEEQDEVLIPYCVQLANIGIEYQDGVNILLKTKE
ncbi:MAG: DUF4832 domain-containing protein [Lachnospiraceae bacterium]|nr:DUF4832 domain-containing protein [Lachnospiraceae bacterium]